MTVPRQLSDRYELGEILGFGGMSEVHLGRDVRLHRTVAIKLLRADLARDPDCYLRFRREAQHAAALNHPAIVAVYDTGTIEAADGLLPYIVMEYVDGVTLRDIVHEHGPVAPRRAIEIIADVCQALNFSHQHGTIHRDVKPANIMISKTGAVKVMDFGIARALTDTGNRLTQTAAILGTAHYLSPEQARGETVDARSDVYSLGCVLYEMLTGEAPFVGDSPLAVAYKQVREDPAPPSRRLSGISPELDAVVLHALAKNPENRYQSAAEMRADLILVHGGQAPDAPKVLTDAETSELVSASPLLGQWQTSAHVGTGGGDASPGSGRGRRLRLWLAVIAVLTALTVVLTTAMNSFGNGTHSVRVPDVHGQTQQDAIASLQNVGFEIRGPVAKSDPTVPDGHVIDTDPAAHTALAGGDAVTINVSAGPPQREVPSCSNLTADDCIRSLADSGFGRTRQMPIASATVPPNQVIRTNPAAGRLSVLVDEVTVEVSTGPETRRVPDVSGQSVDEATANLKAAGFDVVLRGAVDSTRPLGYVISTDPSAGVSLSIRSAIVLRVSRGNQFSMPNLVGMTYVEMVPYLKGLGHVGPLLNGGDVPGADEDQNRVVQQAPSTGSAINRDGTVTVRYGS
ncbi:Stk1 family PASTA domain-containing Ser/Thr kinase [Mycolicibacterium hodleri]|uniref:Serine/threonine-protein kinase PknB n=1 Tax=Mycolicibacterium hodleri TaxID=49897 RepID=A0A502EJM8_9MYCO|nr:Stk1 family PASTA domain-containing Ser/Thr kinase [Mycolicibacterium hodleri]TPG36706.1 Stk1 family PASTA domain-containing Ser/Thr kinase [Mycolicibacterium hodleri]